MATNDSSDTCDYCSDDNPAIAEAWSYSEEAWVWLCEKCVDKETPDKWNYLEGKS